MNCRELGWATVKRYTIIAITSPTRTGADDRKRTQRGPLLKSSWQTHTAGLTHHNSETGSYGKSHILSKPRLLPFSVATFR